MTPIFEKIMLQWDGREYVIQPTDVMQCLAKIEDVVTLVELNNMAQKHTLPLAKLSQAFSIVLRHAGAEVSADEVYAGMFGGDGEMQKRAQAAVMTLLTMMIPPQHLRRTAEETATRGKVKAASKGSLKKLIK